MDGYRNRSEFKRLLQKDYVKFARAYNDGPVLIDSLVEKHDIVYPMVPAGASLHNMIRRPMEAVGADKE